MKKSLVFDTGPIITLALNNLLWLLPKLKESFGGEFYIASAVRKELVEQPLTTKKFKLEALQILPYINDGTLVVVDAAATAPMTQTIAQEVNSIYSAKGHPITIMQAGEIDAISCALLQGAAALVVDERNTRYLIETPDRLHKRLEGKLHTRVDVDADQLKKVSAKVKGLNTIRTAEILTVAFENGLLNSYLDKSVPHARYQLLEGLLWGAKLHGCAITELEIDELLKMAKSK